MVVVPIATELLREHKRMLDKSIRELDREVMGLHTQEKKLIVDIKKAAKEGQMVCCLCPHMVLTACSSLRSDSMGTAACQGVLCPPTLPDRAL